MWTYDIISTRQKIEHHHVPFQLVIICANKGTWKCDNAANMTTASSKTKSLISQLPTLAAPTLTQLSVECRNALKILCWHLKITFSKLLGTSLCIAKLEVFLAKRVIILVDNFCLCTRLREKREKNETTYYFIYTLHPSIPFLSFLDNVGPRHPVNLYFF